MRERSLARRVVALLIGSWLIVFGVLGAWHVARVAHHTDQAGQLRHASRLVGQHTAHGSDVHAVRGDSAGDVCAIAAALHQAATPWHARPRLHHLAAAHTVAAAIALVVRPARLLLRFAPKTSPPVA